MKKNDWKVIHSSKNDCWRTPPEIFEPLNEEFKFEVDGAALAGSALLPEWYGPDHPDEERRDSLAADWGEKRVFLNPPYGRNVGKWVQKAQEACDAGALVVVLTMACTDTAWWYDFAWKAPEIRLVRGRIRFLREDGTRAASSPKGSALIIFRPGVKFCAPNVSMYPMF